MEHDYAYMRAYGQSKLANVLFTYELARRLKGTGVTATALHPGFVATRLGSSNGGLVAPLSWLAMRTGASPRQGAQTGIYLASSPEVEGISGEFFVGSKPAPSAPASHDEETARRLWEISAQMTSI
jgi:NAD(P)-dependent dehydrogenase (short-subunit alcohol dehydrogenase family)